ncbi:TPA: helix-turn-helix transcriptional regulator [Citrobacter freundii]|uniref:helix-turn-helix domain-containing protein n=1 Tax=Citrobacter freundii complex TaxID=1344959 RepID=UPI001230031B|nr:MULTISPECIES: helix-turn-helix transcriptional regulator [Citrobacter freundii complex]EAY2107924.1 XRE family transcriptional regulator [Salmonella enterica subsp. enterica serovar Typhimurium]EGP7084813.1 helix-turn-helix transcriptional regulator [Salmonella enterica subsp. enterica serovar Minnesota]KAA3562727.1 XRE family transcriptional regulator [Citrobacter freundii]MBA8045075.1 helix-turn-helix transcriptional regulator [Citrobacter freundii]MBE9967579.1 helix-turn-helix transcript
MSLATRVKERRKALNLTQVTLAELTGVSQQAINRIESGIISRPRYLLEISIALQCDPNWLLHGSHNDNKA